MTVLELGECVAAPFCAKLLAAYGARDQGRAARARGPGADSGAVSSLRPRHRAECALPVANTGKASVTADLEQVTGRELARSLAADVDILVENCPPGHLDALNLGYEAPRAENQRLVYVSLSAFGQSGPRARWLATNLTALASGGRMHLTGDPGREPLQAGGEQAEYRLGLNGFSAALVGLWDALETGAGPQIEISAQEAMASTLEAALNTYAYWGRDLWPTPRGNINSALLGIYPCADGFLGVHAMPRNVPPLLQVIEMPALIADARFGTPAARLEHNDELTATIFAWAADKTKHALYARRRPARADRLCARYGRPAASPRLAARGFPREVEHPAARWLTYPGPPFALSATPGQIGPAPLLGEHTDAVLRERLALSDAALKALRVQKVI